jgi:predicted N-formylglutamate amidohydrolase
MTQPPLLGPDEPSSVSVYNEHARSPFVIVCDHAGKEIPRALGNLGLTEEDLTAHIAWDIGAAEVARLLAVELDAVLFLQHYSRLVIDCNRPLVARDSIPEVTGGIRVPANEGLSPAAIQARVEEIFFPYHERIRVALASRESPVQEASLGPQVLAAGRAHVPYILLAMHSFTPVLYGVARRFHAGVLYHADTRLAAPLLERLRAEPALVIGENEPYAASPATDYSIIEHAERNGAPYVEIEVRQDLIAETKGQVEWAARLARSVRAAVRDAALDGQS